MSNVSPVNASPSVSALQELCRQRKALGMRPVLIWIDSLEEFPPKHPHIVDAQNCIDDIFQFVKENRQSVQMPPSGETPLTVEPETEIIEKESDYLIKYDGENRTCRIKFRCDVAKTDVDEPFEAFIGFYYMGCVLHGGADRPVLCLELATRDLLSIGIGMSQAANEDGGLDRKAAGRQLRMKYEKDLLRLTKEAGDCQQAKDPEGEWEAVRKIVNIWHQLNKDCDFWGRLRKKSKGNPVRLAANAVRTALNTVQLKVSKRANSKTGKERDALFELAKHLGYIKVDGLYCHYYAPEKETKKWTFDLVSKPKPPSMIYELPPNGGDKDEPDSEDTD